MGRIPPSPPPEYVECTTLSDPAPRYIRMDRAWRPSAVPMLVRADPAVEAKRLARFNAIGAVLLAALILQSGFCAGQALGVW